MSTGRIVIAVFGAIILLISFGLSMAGGGILWINASMADDDGYYMTDNLHMQRDSYAIISEAADVDLGSDWAFDGGDLVTFREEVRSSNPSRNIFVGVAREDDLMEYLQNVSYDRLTDFELDDDTWEFENIPGTSRPAPPTLQTFWHQSSHGAGTQVIEWELEQGTWVFVIMNEDGSAGIELDMQVGVKVPWLTGLGVGLLVTGIIGLIIGSVMIFFAVRRPHETVENNQIFS